LVGIYGRYVTGSDGWDDGFNEMRDTGDDASAYLITFAEPDDDFESQWRGYQDYEGDDEKPPRGDPDQVGYDDDDLVPRTPDPRRRTLAVPEHEVYRRQLLVDWVAQWGDIGHTQRQRSRGRRFLAALARYPEPIVLEAIRSVNKLDRALTLVEYWSEGDTRLDAEDGLDEGGDPTLELPRALNRSDLIEAVGYVLEQIADDLVDNWEARELLLSAACSNQPLEDVCQDLEGLRSEGYRAWKPLDPGKVAEPMAYIRRLVDPIDQSDIIESLAHRP
jgi:hypothetical protein